MKTYKVNISEETMQCIIAAMRIYKDVLFDNLTQARDKSRWNWISKRRAQVKRILEQLETLNDPV